MLIQQLNRSDAEKVFISVRDVSASSITRGYGACLAIGGNSFDGNAAVLSDSDGNAADLPGFIGVADADIAVNAYGLVQTWGFATSVFLSAVGSSITINQGNPLVPGRAPGGLFSLAPTYAASGLKFVLVSNTPPAISAAAYASGLVRCI